MVLSFSFLNIETSERNGGVVSSIPVSDSDEVILVTNSGKLIRLPVKGIRIAGRVTQGVKLVKLDDGASISSITRVISDEDPVKTKKDTKEESKES